nr:MAG TPA: hypothetical protein [Caudoviricetes sp.]
MDHWYRSMKDRASWRDYESQLKVVTAMKPSPTLRHSFDLVDPVDQLCDPPV